MISGGKRAKGRNAFGCRVGAVNRPIAARRAGKPCARPAGARPKSPPYPRCVSAKSVIGDIFGDMRRARRARNGGDVLLQVPAQNDLRRRASQFSRNAGDGRRRSNEIAASERAIGDEADAMARQSGDEFRLIEARMVLALQGGDGLPSAARKCDGRFEHRRTESSRRRYGLSIRGAWHRRARRSIGPTGSPDWANESKADRLARAPTWRGCAPLIVAARRRRCRNSRLWW